jgi:AcrR family transcriptional regulator
VLVDATLRLLREHGRQVTSRQIAEEARVAEGTIFRVFATKDELVDAAIARAFVPGAMVERLAEIDPALPLEERLVRAASVLQQRYRATFDLMAKVGLVKPPPSTRHAHDREEHLAQLTRMLVEVVGADADRLSVPAEDLVHRLRMLVFVGSHPHLSDGRLVTAEDAVHTVLYGLLRTPAPESQES